MINHQTTLEQNLFDNCDLYSALKICKNNTAFYPLKDESLRAPSLKRIGVEILPILTFKQNLKKIRHGL